MKKLSIKDLKNHQNYLTKKSMIKVYGGNDKKKSLPQRTSYNLTTAKPS